jgi:hypothetical protein
MRIITLNYPPKIQHCECQIEVSGFHPYSWLVYGALPPKLLYYIPVEGTFERLQYLWVYLSPLIGFLLYLYIHCILVLTPLYKRAQSFHQLSMGFHILSLYKSKQKIQEATAASPHNDNVYVYTVYIYTLLYLCTMLF